MSVAFAAGRSCVQPGGSLFVGSELRESAATHRGAQQPEGTKHYPPGYNAGNKSCRETALLAAPPLVSCRSSHPADSQSQ